MNAMGWAERNLKALGDFDAFVSADRVWRSRAAHERGARLTSGLAAMGVTPGDRVLLWLPNGPELVIAWRAVLRAGGIAVVAHDDSPLQRIAQLAAETTAAAIVTAAARFGPEANGLAIRHRIQADPGDERPGWHSVARIVAEYGPQLEPVPRSGRDPAFITYTSGTTGMPRGIVTRHDALIARLKSVRNYLAPYRRPVRRLALLPMSTAFGSGLLFEGLAKKCTLYFLGRFDAEEALKTVETHRIEWMSLVPTMCEALLAVPEARRYDLSSLATALCGGANVSPDLVDRFRETFGIRLRVAYGMSGIGAVSQTSSHSMPGSVGRPISRLRARAVDAEGRELPVGEVGELVLDVGQDSGFEYWNPGAPAIAAAGADGWYRTGDLVRFDAQGELYVVGRTDDLIIQGGHNIHGQAIADVVQRLPGVRECAAVGIPNAYLGQEAVICAALHEGAELTAGDILAHCREHLEARAVPASVWFVAALPRNEAGKVVIHELREAIQTARGAVTATGFVRQLAAAADSERHAMLRETIRSLLDETLLRGAVEPPAEDEAAFRDMGLDSLGAVELTHALSEALGRRLPDDLLYTHPTIDAVSDFLLQTLGLHSASGIVAADAPTPAPRRAETIRLADFLSPLDLETARRSMPGRDLPPRARVVFLTGANGFLGRFLVLEILRRISHEEGEIYCLVRTSSRSSPFDRLRSAYASDTSLQLRFDQLAAAGRLTVLGGDLTQPRFGLPEETYARLCGEVDCIVHNGAVVDHLLGLAELFAPNVAATAEIARFAVAQRIKRINYVSTIAVHSLTRWAFVRSDDFAAGYSASKWASERLLKELHDSLGAPVRVYRACRLMAHSEYRGQINIEDAFTRLLHGIVTASVAPQSFYSRGRRDSDAYYNGLPVDAVARSIAALSTAGGVDWPSHIEYHVVNPHRGVDLDVIVEWVRSAGYRVERIDDYTAWHRALENRLSSLTLAQRQRSLLPLIHMWKRPLNNSEPRFDAKVLHRHLAQLSESEAEAGLAEIPAIDEAFIHKSLADMRAQGLIGPAG